MIYKSWTLGILLNFPKFFETGDLRDFQLFFGKMHLSHQEADNRLIYYREAD